MDKVSEERAVLIVSQFIPEDGRNMFFQKSDIDRLGYKDAQIVQPQSYHKRFYNNNNNNNILLTAIGLSPGGSGYYACT